MASPPWWTPTTKVALALVGVAALGVATYRHGWLHDWMPNVVVGALTVALTITVIDRVVGREAQDRVRLRVDAVMAGTGEALQALIPVIVEDYVEHHVDDFKPVPNDISEMIELWLSSHHTESTPPPWAPGLTRPPPVADLMEAGPWMSPVVAAGQVFAQQLERHRARDREVMAVGLIHAIDEFAKAAAGSTFRLNYDPRFIETVEAAQRRTTVEATQEFVKAFTRYAAPQWLSIDEFWRTLAAGYAESLRAPPDEP